MIVAEKRHVKKSPLDPGWSGCIGHRLARLILACNVDGGTSCRLRRIIVATETRIGGVGGETSAHRPGE